MGFKLNDLNGEASEYAFGFKATSRSLKPVHLAQVIFNQILEYGYEQDRLFEFVEKPSKTPSSDLSDDVIDRIEFIRQESDEELDQLRQRMRKVLANDNALYSSQRGSAPTCTSDWFVTDPMTGVTAGRFLHQVLSRAESDIEQRLKAQLRDHHDSVSLLFRPFATEGQQTSATQKPWREPPLGATFGDGTIADEFVNGFSQLGEHLKEVNGRTINYPRDLRRVVKFGCVAFFLYMANRHNEIRTDENTRSTRVPIVLNHTDTREGPIPAASLESTNIVQNEVRAGSRLGIREALDRSGYRSKDEQDILDEIDNRELLDLNRQSDQKRIEDYETFRDIFTASPGDTVFDRLVNAVTDAIHVSRYNTYTPVATTQTFGWRAGLLKPRGNRANERRFEPDPEILEAILLSVVGPDQSRPLQEVCRELRSKYGIIVGGTDADRDHLSEWDISIGASRTESDPLKNRNYEGFKQAVVELGYAREYADGVTIVSTN